MSTMPQRSHVTDSEAWRVVGSVNGSETPKYERYSSPTHLRSATGTTVSIQAVRNRLDGVVLYARRSMSQFGGGGVLVYGGYSIDECTDLCIIRDGPLTARRYRDKILRPIVVLYAAAVGDDFILMDDNCMPHRANLMEDFLFEERIVRMEWPACSPDMNLTEHVWDALRRRVAGHQPPPQTLQELERDLLEEWDRIPQLMINSLIDSMPQSILDPCLVLSSNVSVQSIECLLCQCHRPITSGPFRSLQDFSAETVDMTNIDLITTPPGYDLTTNQGSLIQPGPSTSGHIDKLDLGGDSIVWTSD
ncbi:transposable element Tcb2 transposase [Trichonephila clavipes]|nr:transposable element Tcb2 transposase [Trichonephila clavipes]